MLRFNFLRAKNLYFVPSKLPERIFQRSFFFSFQQEEQIKQMWVNSLGSPVFIKTITMSIYPEKPRGIIFFHFLKISIINSSSTLK